MTLGSLPLGVAPITTPDVDWLGISPVIALAAAGILIVLSKALLRGHRAAMPVAMALASAGVIAAGVLEIVLWNDIRDNGPITTVAGMVRVDLFGVFLGAVVVIATLLAVLLSIAYLRREGLDSSEYLGLLLLSGAGMLAMTTANDLIAVFLALEVLSIPLYVLAAFDRRRAASQEAGIKYFVLGAFSSAVFLYGVALTYGATGTTSLTGIHDFLAQNTLLEQGTLLAGFALLLVGLGFKVAAVPFHMWTPDVYQGAPTPITAFMSAAVKAAAFAALLRVFGVAFPLYSTDWKPAIVTLSVLSLVVGSVAAVVQTDIKRMLAYSSIAHAGYVLMGFADNTARGREAALFYLFVYTFMSIGAFAVITLATREGRRQPRARRLPRPRAPAPGARWLPHLLRPGPGGDPAHGRVRGEAGDLLGDGPGRAVRPVDRRCARGRGDRVLLPADRDHIAELAGRRRGDAGGGAGAVAGGAAGGRVERGRAHRHRGDGPLDRGRPRHLHPVGEGRYLPPVRICLP